MRTAGSLWEMWAKLSSGTDKEAFGCWVYCPAPASSNATDINDRGKVVGVSGGNELPAESFIWDRRRGMRRVDVLALL